MKASTVLRLSGAATAKPRDGDASGPSTKTPGGNVIPRQPLPTAFRIFSSGKVETTKGTFLFDDVAAKAVMKAWKSYGNDIQIDYEHKSVDPASKAGDGLAAGWCRLAVKNGELWAVQVRWTEAVAAQIVQGAWKYMSPTFDYDHKTGRIQELLNVALTNIPATKNLTPLVAAGRESLGGAVGYRSYPIVKRAWDRDAAVLRMRAWAKVDKPGATKEAWANYAQGFAWVDSSSPYTLAAYKLPHHDIASGKLVTIADGVKDAVSSISDVGIPEKDIVQVKTHLATHLHAMGLLAPWEPKPKDPQRTSKKQGTIMATKTTKAGNRNAKLGLKKTKKTVTETTEDDAAEVAADGAPNQKKDIAVDELDEAEGLDEADEMDEADEADELDEADEADEADEMDESDESDDADDSDDSDSDDDGGDPAPGPAVPAKKTGKGKGPAVPAKKCVKSDRRGSIASLSQRVVELSREVQEQKSRTVRAAKNSLIEKKIETGFATPAIRKDLRFVAEHMTIAQLKGYLSRLPKIREMGGGYGEDEVAGSTSIKVGKLSLTHDQVQIAKRSGAFELLQRTRGTQLLTLADFTKDGTEH